MITRFIVECVGVITDFQILHIDQRVISIMFTLFMNRRIRHLRFVDAFEKIQYIGEYFGKHRNCFGKNCFEKHWNYFW
jgi:hypothetical protein